MPRRLSLVCALGWPLLISDCSCTYENSVDVPGPIRQFDPIAALPKVLSYAGAGAELVSIEVLHAREDGTVDLKADYYPGWTVPVRYQVVRPNQAQPDPSIPLGARPASAPFELVEIEVMKPHWRTVTTNGSEWTSKHRGMLAESKSGLSGSMPASGNGRETVAQPPQCNLAQLWQVARQRSAPAGAVATIRYDRSGYHFTIPQTAIDFHVDSSCR
jgi:hypothetical protein